jgi:anion-transporting  ArsA/GET3 family ATPase
MLQNAAALATASHAAAEGKRVLVVGTGPVGLLSHLLERSPQEPLPSRPQSIAPNLDAMEMVAVDEFNRGWETLCNSSSVNIPNRLLHLEKDELPSFPGMEEVATLLVVDQVGQAGNYDLVVFGGTTIDSLLRGISLRETVRWFVRLVGGLDRGPGRSQRSLDAALLPISLLSASTYSLLQDVRLVLEQYANWLTASAGTRIRLALSTTDMSLPMMRYALGGSGLYGLSVDTIFTHGDTETIEPAVRDHLTSLLLPIPFSPTPTDVAGWAERGATLYGSRAEGLALPEQATSGPPPLTSGKDVRLHIPFLDRKSLDIGVASEEVIVRMGPFRRHLLVPGMEQEGGRLRARTEGEWLHLWVEQA